MRGLSYCGETLGLASNLVFSNSNVSQRTTLSVAVAADCEAFSASTLKPPTASYTVSKTLWVALANVNGRKCSSYPWPRWLAHQPPPRCLGVAHRVCHVVRRLSPE